MRHLRPTRRRGLGIAFVNGATATRFPAMAPLRAGLCAISSPTSAFYFPIARAAARGLAQPGFNEAAPCRSRYPPSELRDLAETLVLSRMIGPGLSSTTMTACKICPGHLQSSSRSLLHRQLWRSVPFEIRLRFRRVSANRHIFLATPRGYSLTRGRGNAARPPESVARRLCCHVGPKKQMMARDS